MISSRLLLVAAISSALFLLVVADSPNGHVQIQKKLIDSPLEDIQWADMQTVFVLTERGKVYLSNDGGNSWALQTSKLHAGTANPAIRSVHISRVDPRKVFLMGHGNENWMTVDQGKTYKQTQDIDLHEVKLHPRQSKWILGASMSSGCKDEPKENCYKELHLSKDFGETWSLVEKYVVQFDWPPVGDSHSKVKKTLSHHDVMSKGDKDPDPTHDDDLVYATVHDVRNGNQRFGMWDKNIHFVQSYDYFKSKVLTVKHGNRFLFGEHNYLFVAAVNPHQENEVSLQVSQDTGAKKVFKTALLPVDLTEHSYTILDTSEGTVFLHVNHAPFDTNAPTGHVYISDWSGTRYSLSLPYNQRSPDGKCDFEKVEGLEGIYLANFIDEEEDETNENWDEQDSTPAKKHKKTKTVITFDKGAIWSYLEAPSTDSTGAAIHCPGCKLMLSGITSLYGPFYSSRTAVGMIMSTGVVGRYLQESTDRINTYLSRDAGLSWYEVSKGSHIYEFGDHGGLIVMAYDEGETDSIVYSWDQGVTWKSLKISDSPMQVENIIIEPQATSQQFVVYGWQDDSGVLVYVDFSELHERECQGHDAPDSKNSDYETWTPSDGRLGGRCLLGHKVAYTRRKRTSQCFNPIAHESFVMHEHCACSAEDFECDYGYYRKTQNGPCEKDPDAEPEPKQPCKDFYYVTKGYRRVSGDTCTSGSEWERVQVPCPSWSGSHIGRIILLLLAIVVVSLFVATFYGKSEFLEDIIDKIKGRFTKFDYDLVGQNTHVSAMADDDFGLDGDEFGQSAHLMQDQEDVENGGESQFKPLKERHVASSVPALAPPKDSVDGDFNPRQ